MDARNATDDGRQDVRFVQNDDGESRRTVVDFDGVDERLSLRLDAQALAYPRPSERVQKMFVGGGPFGSIFRAERQNTDVRTSPYGSVDQVFVRLSLTAEYQIAPAS